jgi:hypothetical protein
LNALALQISAIADLLCALREGGAEQQAASLAARAAGHAALDDPGAVADLRRDFTSWATAAWWRW